MLDGLFTGNTIFFSVPALAGTFFFSIRLVLSFFGMDDAGDGGSHMAGADAGGDAQHSTELFKFLSIQSIAAFLMGFGWFGLGGLRGAGWEFGSSLLIAVGGGLFLVWMLGWMLKIVHDLQSSGTVSIKDALHAEGEVYTNVPAAGEGVGRVKVIIGNRQRIYAAVSEGEALTTNTAVRVTRVHDNNTLTVARST